MALMRIGIELVVDGEASAVRAMNNFGSAVDHATGQTTKGSEIMTGALRQIGVIAIDAAMQAGRALVGFVSDSVSAAGDFEAGMNRFAAVAGGSLKDAGLDLKDFRDQFIQIGKELPVSTSEVQQAAIEMVKGGIDPATIAAGGLRQVIQFAAAADMDLAQSAEIAAKALGGWVDIAAPAEEKAAFLAHSTDLLAKAANASTVDVDDLALGMYNVQGTAKLAGVSFDETVTALAQLAPSFSSSADAGTSFKTFLARLQPTTDPAIVAMTKLGLYTEETGSAFYDAQGNFVGMEAASRILAEATAGLTNEQKQQYLQTIFGQDAIRTAAVFSEQGAEGYNNMASALANQNSVAEMAAQKQAGFNTALDNAQGSMEALKITVGSALLPVLTDLLNNVIAPGINFLTDLAGALAGDEDAFGRLGSEGQTLVGILQELWAGIQDGIAFAQDIIGAFQDTSSESSALGGVLDDLSGVWDNLMGVIQSVAAAYERIIRAVLPIVQKFWAEHGDEIMAVVQELWDTIILVVNAALAVYNAIIPPILNAIADFISDNQDTILKIIENAWTTIKSVIDIALALIQGIIKTVTAIIAGDWEGAWQAIQETAERIWEDIQAAIGAQIDTLKTVLSGAWDAIKSTASSAWEGIKSTIEGLVNGLIDTLLGLPAQVAGVGAAIVNEIAAGFQAAWDGFWADVQAKLSEFRDTLPFSEPKDPSSPLRGLSKSGYAIGAMLQQGLSAFGALETPRLVAPPASAVQMMAGGSTSVANTYNRTYNYSPTYAQSPRAPAVDFGIMAAFGS